MDAKVFDSLAPFATSLRPSREPLQYLFQINVSLAYIKFIRYK